MSSGYTDAELLKLDPQLATLFKKRGIPKLPLPTRNNLQQLRAGFAAAITRFNASPFAQTALPSPPTWTETDHAMLVSAGDRAIPVRVYAPHASKPDGRPVLVFAPAGGWFMGDLDTEAFLCRLFCARLEMVVFNVAYGLYPEVAFDVPQQDCFEACKWVAAHAVEFGGDVSKGFVWGGNSGGCTWMSVAAHRWVEEGLKPKVTGTFFLCPIFTDEFLDEAGVKRAMFDRETQNRSWDQCENAVLMSRGMSDSIEALNTFDFGSRFISPFRFPNHAGMGVSYIAVCGIDPWRDTGILYAEELRKQNVAAKLEVYPGLLHCWWSTFPQIDATKQWLDRTLAGMSWVLGKGISGEKGVAKL